jgi:hypothetical protein
MSLEGLIKAHSRSSSPTSFQRLRSGYASGSLWPWKLATATFVLSTSILFFQSIYNLESSAHRSQVRILVSIFNEVILRMHLGG